MKRSVAFVCLGISFLTTPCAAADAARHDSKVVSLHAQLITPASDALFQAESKPPATSSEWARILARADDLTRAAQALELLEWAKEQQEWLRLARALAAAAGQAARAAREHGQDALVSANGEIVSVCEDCHAKYRDAGRSMKE